MVAMSSITYGEALVARSMSMRLVAGKWVADKIEKCNPRMSRDEAGLYYSEKLKAIWMKILTKEGISLEVSERIIFGVSTNSLKYRRYCSSQDLVLDMCHDKK